MQTIVISLGGSIIVPEEIDIAFLKKLWELVISYVSKGNRIIMVCGGGSICRKYQQAAEQLIPVTNENKDWIGIMATRLNAELVRVMFAGNAYEKVIINPNKKVRTNKRIIIAAGYEPGWSTDYDAVLLAKSFKAKKVINATNIDYVYDKDPNKFNDAKFKPNGAKSNDAKSNDANPIENISWKNYLQLVGGEFVPGMHTPFDPVASRLAEKEGIKVIIVNGNNLDNLKNVIEEKEFKGTVIG